MKRILSMILTVCLLSLLTVNAYADHLATVENGTVTYTADGTLDDNFNRLEDVVKDLLPGDDITVVLKLRSENAEDCNWYMSNTVVNSLEDGSGASGSAYGYRLSYVDPEGEETVLFDSETVGGDGSSDGLKEATGALKDYFYLDTLNQGDEASVKLSVSLDGETEGNDYFNTLADLEMRFAVEPNAGASNTVTERASAGGNGVGRVVSTGDEAELFPYYVAMAVSGILLLMLATDSVLRRRKKGESK